MVSRKTSVKILIFSFYLILYRRLSAVYEHESATDVGRATHREFEAMESFSSSVPTTTYCCPIILVSLTLSYLLASNLIFI